MEGSHQFYGAASPARTPFMKPTVEHHHSEGSVAHRAIVYHGEKFPELGVRTSTATTQTGHIWAVKHTGEKIEWHKKIAITTLKITGFAFAPNQGGIPDLPPRGPDDGGYSRSRPTRKSHLGSQGSLATAVCSSR